MKILLTGSSGLLGSEFKRILSQDVETPQWGVSTEPCQLLAPTHQELELLEEEKVSHYLSEHQPDLIIHCVAYTQVDTAETDRQSCQMINVGILENLLKSNTPVIHFSSDYVFSGEGAKTGRGEDEERQPINYYGETKVEAEKLLENWGGQWWNIRTSWLFGETKSNFIDKILTKASTHDRIQVVDDQIGRPTYVKDLAEFVVKYFIRGKDSGQAGMTDNCSLLTAHCSLPSGHYHLQGSGTPVSWADLAEFVIEEKGFDCQVERVSSQVHNSPARRPAFSVLENTKLDTGLRDWENAAREYLESIEGRV